jgi:hypothetical protein
MHAAYLAFQEPRNGEHDGKVDAEQVARNDAVFRDANEHIADVANKVGAEDPLPFICECADPACRELIRLSRGQYERVRKDPKRFAIAPGHAEAAEPFARVVERRNGFWVVEKTGRAATLAAELDSRTA